MIDGTFRCHMVTGRLVRTGLAATAPRDTKDTGPASTKRRQLIHGVGRDSRRIARQIVETARPVQVPS